MSYNLNFNDFEYEQDSIRKSIDSQFQGYEPSSEEIEVQSVTRHHLIKSETSEEFYKSWSTDLKKRFPNSEWRTINGAKVLINNGKVIAGLNGFNEHIDKFFEGKKKEGVGNKFGNKELQFNSFKEINEYADKHNLKTQNYGRGFTDGKTQYWIKNEKEWVNSKNKHIPIIMELKQPNKQETKTADKPKEDNKKEGGGKASSKEVPKSFEKVFNQIKDTGHGASIQGAKMIANNKDFSVSKRHEMLGMKLESAKKYQQGSKEQSKTETPKDLKDNLKSAWDKLENTPKKTEAWSVAKKKYDAAKKAVEDNKQSKQDNKKEGGIKTEIPKITQLTEGKKFNGKIYGSDKSGYSIYINGDKTSVTKEDVDTYNKYIKDKESKLSSEKDLNNAIFRNLKKILKDFPSKTYTEKTKGGKIIIDQSVEDKVIDEIKEQANFSISKLSKDIEGNKFESTFLMKDGKPYMVSKLVKNGKNITGHNFDTESVYKQLQPNKQETKTASPIIKDMYESSLKSYKAAKNDPKRQEAMIKILESNSKMTDEDLKNVNNGNEIREASKQLLNEISNQKPKEEKKLKESNTVSNKTVKDLDTFGKQKLDNEKTETISKLSNLASKLDEKYLSAKTKDKLNKLIEDIQINAWGGSDNDVGKELGDKLYESKSIKDTLSIVNKVNKKLDKVGEYSLEEDMVNKIQDTLVEAAKEQLNKKTTEKKQYKLF